MSNITKLEKWGVIKKERQKKVSFSISMDPTMINQLQKAAEELGYENISHFTRDIFKSFLSDFEKAKKR